MTYDDFKKIKCGNTYRVINVETIWKCLSINGDYIEYKILDSPDPSEVSGCHTCAYDDLLPVACIELSIDKYDELAKLFDIKHVSQ